jgi:hypothetical protein
MELVKRLPVEVVRLVFSFGSIELRAQKEKYLTQIRTRLPKYLHFLLDNYPLVDYFFRLGAERRFRIFNTVRRCCCCSRHLARRPIHANDSRMFYFHNRTDEPECHCPCRFLMRRISRANDFEYE